MKKLRKHLSVHKRNKTLFNKLEKHLTRSFLQNSCSEKFEKISRKTSVVVYSFWFYYQGHSTKDAFFAIFSNIEEHLRAAASEIIQESSLNSFLFYRSSYSQELQQRILKNRVSQLFIE